MNGGPAHAFRGKNPESTHGNLETERSVNSDERDAYSVEGKCLMFERDGSVPK